MTSFASLWEGLLNIIFPQELLCPLCQNKPLAGAILCSACLKEIIPRSKDFGQCQTCGKWGPFQPGQNCRECQGTRSTFTLARGVGPYQGLLKEAIYALKYTGRRTLAKPLGQLMASEVLSINDYGQVDLVVPVPLHHHKLRQRGFNQAELLAKEISKSIRVPLASGALMRIKETIAQSKLSKTERQLNLDGAFVLKGKRLVKGKVILLVDDILTTGRTASECARLLMDGGAKRVAIITLATGSIKE